MGIMKNFYCNECEEVVELQNGKCPKCGTDWEKIKKESQTKNESNVNNQLLDTDDFDISTTWNFFINYAYALKIVLFIVAGILALLAIFYIGETEAMSLLLLPVAGALIFVAIFVEKNFKWKAYMLQTNYNIMTKKK